MTAVEGHNANATPAAEEVRSELTAILGSAVFAQAGRSRELLSFVVEETLAGRGDRLKGYTIAVEVFGRAQEFDAQADPLVRVEAGRLRKRLAEYYRGAGQHALVEIQLPRGGYMPVFGHGPGATPQAVSGAALAGAESFAAVPRALKVLGAAAAVVALAVTAFFLLPRQDGTRAGPPASSAAAPSPTASRVEAKGPGPRLLVLPVADLSDAGSLQAFAARVTEELVQAFGSFDIVVVANPAGTKIESTALAALRAEFGVGYVLAGSVSDVNGAVRVAVRLIDAELGTLLWTSTFDEIPENDHAVTAEERVAGAIVMVLASPFGPIFGHEIQRVAAKPLAELDPYECLLRFYSYAKTFGPSGHAESVTCMQRAVRAEPRMAAGWSALATLYLHEHIYGYTPQPDRGPALDRALEAARTSLDIASTGRVAAIALAGIRFTSGDREGFERTLERGLALKPVYPAMQANLGYLLMIAGDHERGFELLDAAVPGLLDVPSYVYVGYALGSLQRGEYGRALEAAQKIDSPQWVLAPLLKAATAALAGRNDVAEREIQVLLELEPDIASSAAGLLERWQLHPAVRETVLEALRSAGLASP